MRRLLLAILLAAYAAVFVRLPSFGIAGRGFDPLEARGREVEHAIEQGRFSDALPLARELSNEHTDDPVSQYWTAETLKGLGRSLEEAQAWERVLELTRFGDAACPALPEAYVRAGDQAKALDAYSRCASAAPEDPERWLDLGGALMEAGRTRDALDAYSRSRALDGSNPRLPALDRVGTHGAREATTR